MERLVLTPAEAEQIRSLLANLATRYRSSEDELFLRNANVYAGELPHRLRSFLSDFKYLEPVGGTCVVSGFPIDHAKIGRTPPHWKARAETSVALEEEMFLVLCGSALGELLGWATQQNGYIVHDILPIREHETSQLGSNSQELLWWHTEDAFHPFRGDYIGLMCLRNDDRVPTTVACIDSVPVEVRRAEALYEPRFRIKPDESHLQVNGIAANAAGAGSASTTVSQSDDGLRSAYERIEQFSTNAERLSVLFGDPAAPYLRLDPYFMDKLDDDPEAQAALDRLTDAIESNLRECVLAEGDVLFIDNYRTVHGRRPFTARYDGTDRWLKRVNVARDLRKSRGVRPSHTSRVIY